MTRWAHLQVGDVVQLRAKRLPGDPLTVTIANVLERTLVDGRGVADPAGVEYREWHYDVTRIAAL